ncbi:MAG: hypothetical protein KKE17_11695 [Proteobacteria bacterium]|nr:hypothetical protein [Pseudomonadota bacterium]MBU1710658.1 hypothetical protein [Pseudomonadota bacterium]
MNHKNMLLELILFGLIMVMLSGCSISMMMRTDTILEPDSAHAIVTFVRPSAFGGAIKLSLWDREKFIGILAARAQVQYLTEPGEHLFIAQDENWSYVKANLEAGKHYFIIGKVLPGVGKALVELDPVNKEDDYQKKTQQWLTDLNSTTVIPEKVTGFADLQMRHINKAIADYDTGDVKFSILESGDHI